MGCCTATNTSKPRQPATLSPRKYTVICDFQGKKEVCNTLNLATIRDQLRRQIPTLVFRSIRLLVKGKEVNSAEELRKEAESGNNTAHLTVQTESGLESSPPDETRNMVQRVHILALNDLVLGTAVLLTEKIALCVGENLDQKLKNDDLKLVFPGENQRILKFNKDGMCLELDKIGKNGVYFLQLLTSASISASIPLNSAQNIENSASTCLFVTSKQYTRHKPILQSDSLSPLTFKSQYFYASDKSLREGAMGAPVFDGNNRLIGVYLPTNVEESGGIVYEIAGIVEKLKGKFAELKPDKQFLLITLVPEPKQEKEQEIEGKNEGFEGNYEGKDEEIEAEKREIVSSPPVVQEEDAYSPVVSPEDVMLKSLPTQDSISLSNPYFTMNLSDNSILRYDSEGRSIASISLPTPLISGFSMMLTPKGLFVTGSDSETKMKTFLITDENRVESLTPTRWAHNFHLSIWYGTNAMVISGLNTETVERYTFAQSYWIQGPNLVHSRANGSAVIFKSSAYIFGGLGRNFRRYKKSIFKLTGEIWTKLGVRLDVEMRRCGCVPTEEGLVVFGGTTRKAGVVSKDSLLEVDMKNSKTIEYGHQALGDFSGACYGEVNGKYLAVSDQGQVFEFQPETRRFRAIKG